MSAPNNPVPTRTTALAEPANERFKRHARASTWVGMLLATGGHLLLFLLWPSMTVEISAETRTASEVVPIAPMDLPDRPAPLPSPARPVAVADIAPDVTIPVTTLDTHRPALPVPPADSATGAGRPALFAPMSTRPRILNQAEVARRLEAAYPSALRDAGVGGEILLPVHIDETGTLLEARVAGSSGFDGLDRAALRVSRAFRFSPALNRDRPVAVWIALPVRFRSR